MAPGNAGKIKSWEEGGKEMFRIFETKRLLKARTRSLEKAENKVEELNKENKAVHEENKILRNDIEFYKDRLREVEIETIKNQYGSIENYTNKIKSILETAKSI